MNGNLVHDLSGRANKNKRYRENKKQAAKIQQASSSMEADDNIITAKYVRRASKPDDKQPDSGIIQPQDI